MKLISFVMSFILLCSIQVALAEEGFSENPEAINEAAKSVLMLEVFDKENELIATGSGFVCFNNRTLVTNYHVIEGADMIIANSDEGYQYIVFDVLIADKQKDIAVCGFLSPTDLKPLMLNTNGELKRAEPIVAIGSPIGITNTVSLGNISAIYIEEGINWIQFTAPISEGSSGGALFDDNGCVIGVTSATYEDTQNINLAVHISEVDELYASWDEQLYSFEDYLSLDKDDIIDVPMSTIMLEPTLNPTPTPTSNPTPTPRPTPTPTQRPIATPRPTHPPTYSRLKKGDTGEAVVALQEALIKFGYLTGKADGIFGDKTAEAVSWFNWKNKKVHSDEALNSTQQMLFHGNPMMAEDDITLQIKNGAYAEWEPLQGDKVRIRFEVNNWSRVKTVTAYELYVYAENVWEEEIYDGSVYYWTTQKEVAPDETVYSDYVTLPNYSDIKYIYCGIHKVAYADGSIYEVKESDIDYSCWVID